MPYTAMKVEPQWLGGNQVDVAIDDPAAHKRLNDSCTRLQIEYLDLKS